MNRRKVKVVVTAVQRNGVGGETKILSEDAVNLSLEKERRQGRVGYL